MKSYKTENIRISLSGTERGDWSDEIIKEFCSLVCAVKYLQNLKR
jgi:hypothetical protein